MKKLSECPICHKSTNIRYACGEYFAYCSSNCPSPACFHPSENTTICSWEDWVEWYCRAQQEQSNKQNYSYLDCLIRNPYVEGCEDCQNGKPPQEPNEPLCGLTNAQLGRLVRNSYIEGYEDGQNGKPSLEKNEPLTLDELREMKGEPVWLHTFSLVQKKTNIAEWAILEAISSVGAVFLRTGCNNRLTKWFTNYDKTWLAYRCKPEQEG